MMDWSFIKQRTNSATVSHKNMREIPLGGLFEEGSDL